MRSRSHGRPLETWSVNDTGLNCCEIHTSSMRELWQLLSGKSISRCVPANGTAGFARVCVSSSRRPPAPPARIKTRVLMRGTDALYPVSRQMRRRGATLRVVDAEFDRAYALHDEGRDEEALAVLRALVERHPESAEAHLSLAPMLVVLGRFDEAAECARLGAERAWNDPYLLVRAATTAWHGDPAAAKVYLGRVDELTGWAPSFALEGEVWHLKGLLAWGDGAREAARAWLEQAFEADPGGLGVGADLALALAECGREEDAAIVIARALESRPGDERLCAARSRITRTIAGNDWSVRQCTTSPRPHRIARTLFERRSPPPRLSVLQPGRQATRRRRRASVAARPGRPGRRGRGVRGAERAALAGDFGGDETEISRTRRYRSCMSTLVALKRRAAWKAARSASVAV